MHKFFRLWLTFWLTILLSFLFFGPVQAQAQIQTANEPAIDAELRKFLKSSIQQSTSFNDRFDAEVWLLSMSGRLRRYVKDPQKQLALLQAVHHEATSAGLRPGLVLALIEVESHFNHYAISRSGAQGLMQVMPFWKNEIGRPSDNLTDINTNLRYGCRILQFYMKKEKADISRALARYNGSLGSYEYPEKVMLAWQRTWSSGDLQ